jgi:hypothetical protein
MTSPRNAVWIALALLAQGAVARGDGGTLREWKRRGSHEIAVFTDPTPIMVGPVDISILLLDPATGEPAPDARVTVEVAPVGRTGAALSHPATREAATNKLMYAAVFELREPGRLEVIVTVDGTDEPAQVRFELDVGTSSISLPGVWPWILWPAPVIAVYGVHRRLVGRKRRL